jgi:hypothetical protein
MRRPLTRQARARRREALRAAIALLGILAVSTAASLRREAPSPHSNAVASPR